MIGLGDPRPTTVAISSQLCTEKYLYSFQVNQNSVVLQIFDKVTTFQSRTTPYSNTLSFAELEIVDTQDILNATYIPQLLMKAVNKRLIPSQYAPTSTYAEPPTFEPSVELPDFRRWAPLLPASSGPDQPSTPPPPKTLSRVPRNQIDSPLVFPPSSPPLTPFRMSSDNQEALPDPFAMSLATLQPAPDFRSGMVELQTKAAEFAKKIALEKGLTLHKVWGLKNLEICFIGKPTPLPEATILITNIHNQLLSWVDSAPQIRTQFPHLEIQIDISLREQEHHFGQILSLSPQQLVHAINLERGFITYTVLEPIGEKKKT